MNHLNENGRERRKLLKERRRKMLANYKNDQGQKNESNNGSGNGGGGGGFFKKGSQDNNDGNNRAKTGNLFNQNQNPDRNPSSFFDANASNISAISQAQPLNLDHSTISSPGVNPNDTSLMILKAILDQQEVLMQVNASTSSKEAEERFFRVKNPEIISTRNEDYLPDSRRLGAPGEDQYAWNEHRREFLEGSASNSELKRKKELIAKFETSRALSSVSSEFTRLGKSSTLKFYNAGNLYPIKIADLEGDLQSPIDPILGGSEGYNSIIGTEYTSVNDDTAFWDAQMMSASKSQISAKRRQGGGEGLILKYQMIAPNKKHDLSEIYAKNKLPAHLLQIRAIIESEPEIVTQVIISKQFSIKEVLEVIKAQVYSQKSALDPFFFDECKVLVGASECLSETEMDTLVMQIVLKYVSEVFRVVRREDYLSQKYKKSCVRSSKKRWVSSTTKHDRVGEAHKSQSVGLRSENQSAIKPKMSSGIPEVPELTIEPEPIKPDQDGAKEVEEVLSEADSQTEIDWRPKLTKSGYFTSPSFNRIRRMERRQLERLRDFRIENSHGVIEFQVERGVDITGIDFNITVNIKRRGVDVYPEDVYNTSKGGLSKPGVGEKLNQPARVLLFDPGFRLKEGQSWEELTRKVRDRLERQGAVFVSLDSDLKNLIFEVEHF